MADYDDANYKTNIPSLIEVIELRMYELELKQIDLDKKLEVPETRIIEYLKGKRDITLEVARKLHHELNIDGDIILQ